MEDRYDTSEFVETSAGRLQHSPTEVSTSVVHESPGEAVPSLNEQRFAVSSTNVIVMEPSAVNSDVLTSVQENLSAEQTVTNELSRDGHVTFVPAVSEENDKAFISEVSRSKDRSRGRRSNSRALSSRFFTSPYGPPSKDYTLRETFYLAYQTLGIVYGDLSTSPLYVYPTINVTDPSERDFLGILSLIFWTLTLIGVLKYTLIVLHADDHGEGGTFAMYSLLCQHANISQHHGEQSPVQDMAGRRLSHLCELQESPKCNRTKLFLEDNVRAQQFMLFFVMLGTCMLVGDGVLTPAISGTTLFSAVTLRWCWQLLVWCLVEVLNMVQSEIENNSPLALRVVEV